MQAITSAAPTSCSISKNKIYDLSNNNATGTVTGIAVSAGTLHTVFNNLVGDLRTTAANAPNPLIGLNITGGYTVNASFNTISLSATSSGALFGSSAISASTTPTITLIDNIFSNASGVSGAGLAVGYRRSSTTITSYGSSSNNNDFNASTIFSDGTNTDTTISAYKTRVASRDSASFNETPNFLSTTGSSVNFLHIDPTIATQIESGGITFPASRMISMGKRVTPPRQTSARTNSRASRQTSPRRASPSSPWVTHRAPVRAH